MVEKTHTIKIQRMSKSWNLTIFSLISKDYKEREKRTEYSSFQRFLCTDTHALASIQNQFPTFKLVWTSRGFKCIWKNISFSNYIRTLQAYEYHILSYILQWSIEQLFSEMQCVSGFMNLVVILLSVISFYQP